MKLQTWRNIETWWDIIVAFGQDIFWMLAPIALIVITISVVVK